MKLGRFYQCMLPMWLSLLLGLLVHHFASRSLGVDTLAWFVALVVSMPLSMYLFSRLMKQDELRIEALKSGLESLRDNDFSVSLAHKNSDGIDELLHAYNQLVEKSRIERQKLYQRELLLDTVIENVSLALLLLDQNDTIIYSNAYTCQLLHKGNPVNGLKLSSLQSTFPDSFLAMIKSQNSGIISIDRGGRQEQYHLSVGSFNFHSSQHRLVMVKQLTRELNRQELAVWRKVIRVISHELNNSLAPISSMAHSAKIAFKKDKPEALTHALNTIADRAGHLSEFVVAYARLAKVPEPKYETLQLESFFEQLRSIVEFEVLTVIPVSKVEFDPRLMQQALLNLIKNAHESGSTASDVAIRVHIDSQMLGIDVLDRGYGINEDVLAQAVLPFFTTKASGSGIGLSLCREIVQLHNGQLLIRNREGGGLCVSIEMPVAAPKEVGP